MGGMDLPQVNAALIALCGVLLFWLKKQITDVFDTVKRLPEQEWYDGVNARVRELPGQKWYDNIDARVSALPGQQWYDEVHKSVKSFPDPDRLLEHFKRVHSLSNDVNVVTLRAEDLRLELKEQKDSQRQDRERLARLEERVTLFAGRRNSFSNGEKSEK